MKASTTRGDDGSVTNFIYEVGDDGADHGKWRAPELMPGRGSGEFYSTSSGASDVAAQYAAALAQSYINFGNSEDLDYAIALYDFAAKYRTITYDQMTYSDRARRTISRGRQTGSISRLRTTLTLLMRQRTRAARMTGRTTITTAVSGSVRLL